jgi:hypothetical protein
MPPQVYTQPVFSLVEARLDRAGGRLSRLPLKMGLRLVYASLITIVAVLVSARC